VEIGKEAKFVVKVRSNSKTKILMMESGKIMYTMVRASILSIIIVSTRVSLKMAGTMVKEL